MMDRSTQCIAVQQAVEALEPDMRSLAMAGFDPEYIDGYEAGFESAKDAILTALHGKEQQRQQ